VSTNMNEQSGAWTGWVIFAAFVLFTIGCFNIIMGLAALLKDETYAVTKNGLLLTTSYTYWGWWLILVGGLMILVALGLFSGNEVARWFAIGGVFVSLITQFGWFPAQPFWSLIIIGLDIAVLYALTAAWTGAKAELTEEI
jgi:hypothetical protein